MIAIPAVDLSGGRSVQWAGGLPETERVSIPDPAGVAARWWRTGFRTLHIVDLDAALGRDDNHAAVRELIASTGAVTQCGGGVRDREGIERALAAGADRVIVGTRAVEDPAWLARAAETFPGRIVVATCGTGRCCGGAGPGPATPLSRTSWRRWTIFRWRAYCARTWHVKGAYEAATWSGPR